MKTKYDGRPVLSVDTVTEDEKQRALHRAVNGLRDDDPVRSASVAVLGWQKGALCVLLGLTVVAAVLFPKATAVMFVGLCTAAYVVSMVDRMLTFRAGLASKAIVIPDEVARAELRARYGLGRRPVIVCLSRLVPRKGQDMLIRALPIIRERIDGAALVIVGNGPHRDDLQKLAQRYDVTDHVVFTGGVPGDELPAHHAMADVFAMPCRTRGAGLDVEGLGIVFLEASATGIPVVAGDSGGAPEAVLDGETGFVVDGRNLTEITDTISACQ